MGSSPSRRSTTTPLAPPTIQQAYQGLLEQPQGGGGGFANPIPQPKLPPGQEGGGQGFANPVPGMPGTMPPSFQGEGFPNPVPGMGVSGATPGMTSPFSQLGPGAQTQQKRKTSPWSAAIAG